MQDLDNIVNGQKLFLKPEYQEVLKNKKEFEGNMGSINPAKVEEIQKPIPAQKLKEQEKGNSLAYKNQGLLSKESRAQFVETDTELIKER